MGNKNMLGNISRIEYKRLMNAKKGSKLREQRAEVMHHNDLISFQNALAERDDFVKLAMCKNKKAHMPIPERVLPLPGSPPPPVEIEKQPEPEPEPEPKKRGWFW